LDWHWLAFINGKAGNSAKTIIYGLQILRLDTSNLPQYLLCRSLHLPSLLRLTAPFPNIGDHCQWC